MELFMVVLGLAMIGGSFFSSLYMFGVGKKAPRWVIITAGIMNILILLSLLSTVI